MATRPDYASTADWREVDTTALPTGLAGAVLPNDRPTAKPRKATLTLASLSEAFRSI
jgi:hypothetical protein